MDFFHSRLQTTTDGKYLLSAGWVWHPYGEVAVFNLENVLENPSLLDNKSPDFSYEEPFEAHAAAFQGLDQIILTGESDEDSRETISVYDFKKNQQVSTAQLEETAGNIMAAGEYAVGFFKCPKLIELKTGKIVHRWEDISSGQQQSSIIGHIERPPHIAMDPVNKRFAVASAEAITVIQLG